MRKPKRIDITIFCLALCIGLAATFFPNWSQNEPIFKNHIQVQSITPVWDHSPAISFGKEEKATILVALLNENRQEIRFWQEKLFYVSFAFFAAIFSLVALAMNTKNTSKTISRYLSFVCIVLCLFHLYFLYFTKGAIGANNWDLIGIQYALGLSDHGEYLKGQYIYPTGGAGSHAHLFILSILNTLTTIASVGILVFFLPLKSKENTHDD